MATLSYSKDQDGIIRSQSDIELVSRLEMNVAEKEPVAPSGMESSVDDDNASHHDHMIIDVPPAVTSSRSVGRRNKVVMKYMVPTLLILIEIKYQVSPDFLFLTNAAQIWCFVASLSVYWPTVQILEKWSDSNPRLTNMLTCIVVACEVLSMFSLMSLLFPRYLPFTVFVTSVSLGLVLLAAIMVVCYVFGSEWMHGT